MKRFSLNRFAGIMLILLLASCHEEDVNPSMPENVDGWAPVYATSQAAYTIQAAEPRATVKAGKIYTKANLLYQIEENEGIHVMDISNPASPKKIKFIAIKGVQEMAIKNNYLYANNLNDLVIADIGNLADVKTVNRIGSAFHVLDPNVPPTSGYFECVDPSKGVIVGWERKNLKHPQCVKH